MNTPNITADILLRELGIVSAIKYAEKIAAVDGPLSYEYRCAAEILREKGYREGAYGLEIADCLKSLYPGK